MIIVSPSATMYTLDPPVAVAVVGAVALTAATARGVGEANNDEAVDVVARVVVTPAVPATLVVVIARVPVTGVPLRSDALDDDAGTNVLSDGSGAARPGIRAVVTTMSCATSTRRRVR